MATVSGATNNLDKLNGEKNPASSTISNNIDKVNGEKNPSKATVSAQRLGDDFNKFLKLFTTQLQNQDPTQPLDTNQLTQQLAQLSSVEQAVQTNLNLEKLVNMFSAGTISNAVGYIGKVVDAKGNTGTLEKGRAEFSYELPAGVSSAQVAISTPSGQVVYTGNAPTTAGKGTFVWKGQNLFTGQQMPDGAYTIKVLAKNSDGDSIDVQTYSTGRVASVDLVDGETTLVLSGGQSVKLADVLSIREASVIAAPQTPQTQNASSGNNNSNSNTGSNNTANNNTSNNTSNSNSNTGTNNSTGNNTNTANNTNNAGQGSAGSASGDGTGSTNAAGSGNNTGTTNPA